MSHHGCEASGFKAFERMYPIGKMNHHIADQQGRAYWCRCCPSFRLKGKIFHPACRNGKGVLASRISRAFYHIKLGRVLK